MIKKILSFFLATMILTPAVWAQDPVDVEANLPSGVYHTPISVELRATDPNAKTFFSFKPDGYPQDAFLYTGAIHITKSTPLVFFSVVSTSDESKIRQNNYTIEYPSVRFAETEKTIDTTDTTIRISLINNSSYEADIGDWVIQSEATSKIIAPHTLVAPGGIFEDTIAYTGSSPIVLQSPDREERGILKVSVAAAKESVIETPPIPVHKSVSKTPSEPKPTPENATEKKPEPIEQREIPPSNVSSSGQTESAPVSQSNSGNEATTITPSTLVTPPADITPVSSPSAINGWDSATPTPITDNLKISVSDSTTNKINPIFLLVFLMASLVLGGVRWYMMKHWKSQE